MAFPNRVRSIDGTPHYSLFVFRVEKDETPIIRILSSSYGGCFVHYMKGGSKYCKGDQCPSKYHSIERQWKGYASVELYEQVTKLWAPVVLEITENMELDFRDRFARGQVWHLSNRKEEGDKNYMARAELLETHPVESFPQPYPIKAVLLRLYHVETIELNKTNPMPPRIMVSPSQGMVPAILQKATEGPKERVTKTMAQLQAEHDAKKKVIGKEGVNQVAGK